jgi:hypothetical protein
MSDYQLSKDSPDEGDLVLVGSDKVGVKVESSYPKAHR